MKAADFIALIILSQIKSLLCKSNGEKCIVNDVWIICDGDDEGGNAMGVNFTKRPAINLNCITSDPR